jgi:hypothetical protein
LVADRVAVLPLVTENRPAAQARSLGYWDAARSVRPNSRSGANDQDERHSRRPFDQLQDANKTRVESRSTHCRDKEAALEQAFGDRIKGQKAVGLVGFELGVGGEEAKLVCT